MKKLKLKMIIGIMAFIAVILLSFNPASAQRRGGEKMKEHQKERMEKMKAELNLTADQLAKIEAINKEALEKMKAVKEKHAGAREMMKTEMKTIRQEKKAKMEAVLTPEQLAKKKDLAAKYKKEHKGKGRGKGKDKRNKN